jgi:hypothetical protein
VRGIIVHYGGRRGDGVEFRAWRSVVGVQLEGGVGHGMVLLYGSEDGDAG